MADHRPRGSSTTILAVGVVLGLFMFGLLGITALGQARLRDAVLEQKQLTVDKKAVAIGLFLAHQRDEVRRIGFRQPLQNYLKNRDLGMSPQYGLQASMNLLKNDLQELRARLQWDDAPLFDRIAVIEGNGKTLVEARDTPGNDEAATYRVRNDRDLQVTYSGGRTLLTLSAPLIYNNHPAGMVVAQIDAGRVMRSLIADPGPQSGGRWSALVTGNGQVIVASDDRSRQQRSPDGADTEQMLRVGVRDTGFFVVARPDPARNHGLITSHWFLGGLALVALGLLGGVGFVLQLNTQNLLLRTRVETTAQQRAVLRKQNNRLQREIDKRVESEKQLAHQANYDQLTGLPNRNLALDRLAQAIKWARREGGNVLVMFLDLDRFKQVNDSLGHAAGDELLREAAKRLLSRVRESDTVSRLGGDEFLVICPDMPLQSDWENCAQQMLKGLSAPFYIGDHEFFVGASIGVATYPDGGRDPDKLLKNADIAMYAAKDQGRNRYCHYDPSMDALALEGMRLENNLRHALARREFYLVYQPIVDLRSGDTVAVEALLRWHSAELGEIPPDKFIPVAEETGLIHEIGEWVLGEACRTVSATQPGHSFRVAVNLSSKQFSRPGRLLECVLHALRQSGLMPNQLELEITESILIDDHPEIANLIHQLDRIGVRLSIDDFGTGYSALNYLQRFPFDVLKIDRSFTSQVPDGAANVSLVRAIIAMAHALGLEVIAEGIEHREQAGFLLIQHCELGQGHLYSRPLTAEQLRRHLGSEQAALA